MHKKLRKHFPLLATVLIFGLILSVSATAQSQATQQISIQGKLTDASGKLLDGSYQMKFDFLNAATSALVKSVGPQAVTVKKGFFTALINPTGLDFSVPYLVDVTVNNQKLSPSFTLSYAPYSVSAATLSGNIDATKIASGTLSDERIPNLPASKITVGAFDSARIPNLDASRIASGTLDAARIGTNAITSDKIADGGVGLGDVGFVAKGKATGATVGTAINFGKTFSSPPVVVCSSRNDKTICDIDSIGSTNFVVKIYDNTGAVATSDIYWIAIGS